MTYVTLMVVCAILALRTWFAAPWIEWLVLAALVPGVLTFARSLPRVNPRKWNWLVWAAVAVLVVDVLYAALPLYRYDQWTYHLLVAKWISHEGTLTPPVTYDHIFFTGNYEFLGLLARSLSSSDTFQQGFQNSLSLLLVTLPAMMMFFQRGKISPAIVIAFALLVIFESGDHEALINSKPDYVLMMSSMLILAFAVGGSRMLNPALAGFLLVGGIGFKITWLHFAACAPVIMWRCSGKDRDTTLRQLGFLLFGGAVALPCLLPWAIKNLQFFGNPLHPAQSPAWHSTMWDATFDSYWRNVARKPSTPGEFLANALQVVRKLPERWGLAAVTLLLVTLVSVRSRAAMEREEDRIRRRGWIALGSCLAIYVAAWGVFYKAAIFNRFVAPTFAFPLLLTWWAVKQIPGRVQRAVTLCLMIPVVANAQLEVSVPRIARSTIMTWLEYARTLRGPMEKVPDLLDLAADRATRFPGASFTKATLMSDFPFNYYGPSAFWITGDVVTAWQMRQAGVDPVTGDGMEFLRKMDIKYVWITEPGQMGQIPPAIRAVLPGLRRIPSRTGTLHVLP